MGTGLRWGLEVGEAGGVQGCTNLCNRAMEMHWTTAALLHCCMCLWSQQASAGVRVLAACTWQSHQVGIEKGGAPFGTCPEDVGTGCTCRGWRGLASPVPHPCLRHRRPNLPSSTQTTTIPVCVAET